MSKKTIITKKDLNKVFWRLNTVQVSSSFERLQAIGTLYSLMPYLEKKYDNHSQEERISAMKRHLQFYNSHTSMNGLIYGITISLEESTNEVEKESINSIKTGLMGPLAGIGDGIIKFTWLPICGSLGATLAMEGNPLGVFLMLILYNIVQLGMKYFGVHYGYKEGAKIIASGGNNIISRITSIGNVLGATVIGGLLVNTVKVSTTLEYEIGENSIVVQEMLDKIMPNLLPLIVTFIIMRILKKTQGKHAALLIIATLIIGIITTILGITG